MISAPWGSWEILLESPYYIGYPVYKVKRLIVIPKEMLSLQYHNHRDEIWTVVSGMGVFWVGKEMIGGLQGDHFEVERGVHHRIVNVGDGDLTVIEVQTGICNEEDIVRLDDKYGR